MASGEPIIINTFIKKAPRPEQDAPRLVPIYAEPRRNNRFMVEFPHMFNIEAFTVRNVNKPKFILKDNCYVWSDISLEFIDLIGPSASRGLFNMIEFCKNHQILKDNKQPLFNFNITDLDPVGADIGTWVVEVEDLVLVDFGDCEYDSTEIQTCKLVIKPLNCRLIN